MHYTNIFHHQLELVTPGPVLNPTLTPVLPKHFKYQSPTAVNDYHRKRQKLQVYEEISDLNKNNEAAADDDDDGGDYFVVKKPKSKRYHKKRKPMMIEVDDYEDLEDEDDSDSDLGTYKYNKKFIKSIRTKKWHRQDDQKPKPKTTNGLQRQGKRKDLNQFDWDGGFEYEDQNLAPTNNEYNYDDYDDDMMTTTDLRNTTTKIPPPRERAVYEPPPKHRRAYSKWSAWTKCSPKCTTRRYK